jgi:DNA-binding NtrC family response regulator
MRRPDTETVTEVRSSGDVGAAPLRQHLFVVLSCDALLDGGSRHSLDSVDEVTIGRGDLRAVRRTVVEGVRRLALKLPGRSLSATHARLRRSGASWLLEDCHSKNGSFVQGERTERVVLRDGDVVEVGRTLLVFRDAVPTPAGTAEDVDSRDLVGGEAGFSTLLPSLATQLSAVVDVARSSLPVVLLGETGAGKEVLARAIHRASGRKGSFVPVNCGAIPHALVESQLFGHMRGAFSGAVRDEPGLVRAAQHGTLLLDEIGDLPPPSQATLLRVLQEGEVLPVGATRAERVDVRVVVATHRPLTDLVARGEFRQDLYARLNGYRHELPPLRARREDLPLLVAAILQRATREGAATASIAPAAAHALLRYAWPSNVRELQQALTRACVLSRNERIERSHLPPEIAQAVESRPPGKRSPAEGAEHELRRQLVAALSRHRGNVSDVAREMGKARMQVQRWMKRLRIDAAVFRR